MIETMNTQRNGYSAEGVSDLIREDDCPAATRWLVGSGTPALLPLIRLIVQCRETQDEDITTIRLTARDAFERLAKRRPDELIRLLDEKHPGVRAEVASQIGELRAHEGRGRLASLVDHDPDPMVVRNAITALGRLRDFSAEPLLVRNLDSADETRREAAVQALAEIGSAALTNRICDLLADPSPKVRLAAVLAAGNVEAHAAIPHLIEIVRGGSWQFAAGAILSLGKLRAVAAVEPIGALASYPNRSVRGMVAEALGLIGSPEALERLSGFASDEDASVRAKAAEAVGRIGDSRGRQVLAALQGDSDEAVRLAARDALNRLREC
jgi:HEAT repeat protein